MKSRTSSILSASCAALLAACGMSAGDSAGGGSGGGNVGFGGAQDNGVFRSILEAGEIPGPSTLDPAGFFAEHYVDLPPADCGQTLCLQSMLAVGSSWVDDSYQATLAVALNTPVDPATVEPRPLDLVVVVDTSGSMLEDDRIGYVKQGLDLLIDQIGAEDRMALVTYESDVTTRAAFPTLSETVPVDENQLAAWREEMHAVVAGLQADGGTNLHGGLQAGFEMALVARQSNPERSQRVILLSDGQPTAGITDEASIIAMAEGYIESGIGLTTIGVGRDFNLALMSSLAERGAGNFYFLEDPQAIQEVFTDELAYFVEPLALSVTVEVRAAAGYTVGEVVGTKLWRTEGGVGSMHLPAVFLASRTSDAPDEGGGRRGGGGTLFVQMLPGFEVDAGAIAEVRVRYRPVDSADYVEQVIEVQNPASPATTPEDAYYSHQAMAKQHAMYNLYLGLRAASDQAQYNYNCALAQLRDLDGRAATWNLELLDDDIEADRALIELFMTNLRERGAQDVPEGQSCYDYGYPGYPVDDVYYDDHAMACSASGNASTGAGLSMILLWSAAGLWATRRRRAR
jgi:Ca-activated chloride channel family protein